MLQYVGRHARSVILDRNDHRIIGRCGRGVNYQTRTLFGHELDRVADDGLEDADPLIRVHTNRNLRVVGVDAERGLVLVAGSVPGADTGVVVIRHAVACRKSARNQAKK